MSEVKKEALELRRTKKQEKQQKKIKADSRAVQKLIGGERYNAGNKLTKS